MANAIEAVCFGRPRPFLDGNMARVQERCFGPRKLADIRYDPYLQTLAQKVVKKPRSLEVNWAVLDLGALVCVKNKPNCAECPIASICDYARTTNAQME